MNYKCDICNKFYATYKTLWYHKKKFHKNPSTENLNLNVHDVHDTVIVSLNEPIINSIIVDNPDNNKSIKCEYCNKIFSSRSAKSDHKKKACKKNPNNTQSNIVISKKELDDFKNNILELLQKNAKIHQKPLQKINKNLINNSRCNHSGSETIKINNSPAFSKASSIENKIIQSEDKKYLFDFDNNLLSFNNKPIKYFYFNNQFYFKGKDVALMLDYDNTKQAIRINVHKDDKINISELFEGGLSYSPPPKY